MNKKIGKLFLLVLTATLMGTISAYAADDIVRIEDTGNESYVASFTIADDVVLPLAMTVSSEDTTLLLNIDHNGQSFRLKPGKYRVDKVMDGEGNRLMAGASLNILSEDAEYYLDFNKPDDGTIIRIDWPKMIAFNIVFIVLALIAIKIFKKYREKFIG